MSNEQLLIVFVGIIAVLLLALIAYLAHGNKQISTLLVAAFGPALEASKRNADAALAPFGPQLAWLNQLLGTIKPLVDEPTDQPIATLSALFGLNASAVASFVSSLVTDAQALTDGVDVTKANTDSGGDAAARAMPSPWERYQAYAQKCEANGNTALDYTRWLTQQGEAIK